MKVVMSIEKLVMHGDGICGNMETGDINQKRKKAKWNTDSRRRNMFKKVKECPEKFISNYRWMKNELGAIEIDERIRDGIKQLFGCSKRQTVVIFEKEPGRRQSIDGETLNESEEQPCEMDITFSELSTVTRSMDDSFQHENEELKAQIKKLEQKVKDLEEKEKRVEPLVKLYERVKEVKNRTGHMIINPNLNRLNIILER